MKQLRLLLVLLMALATPAWADDISGTVNTYVKGSGDVASGATTINYTGSFRGAGTSISPGDLLLLIQSQGAVIDSTNTDQYGDGVGTGVDISTTPTSLHGTPGYAGGLITQTAGTFEYVTVASVSGSQVTLSSAVEHAYSDAGADNWQIIVVPDYLAAGATLIGNVTGESWDGDTGGVIAFNATGGTIDFNGFTVDAAGIGFRGGVDGDIDATVDYIANVVDMTSVMGGKGEGIAGTPRYVFDGTAEVDEGASTLPGGDYGRGAPGNAGGGAGPHNSGGGGGSNAGLGGTGAQGWVGGTPVHYAGYGGQSIFAGANMGGGGGAGDSNNSSLTYGGVGGGVILLRANSGTGSGLLDVSGAEATDATLTGILDGAGGGGAGGTVLTYFTADTSIPGLNIDASGGKGGDADPEHGGGGGGGAGLVVVRANVGTINTSGGAKGANEGVGGVASEPGGDSTPDSGFDAFARLNTDYGDAPDSYGTISGGAGAYHYFADYDLDGIVSATEQLRLGANLDGEAGGNPSANADSDDNLDLDDEDGLTGLSALDPGLSSYTISASSITVTNTLGSSATLHAWIDFDVNGTFDSDEYTSISIANGLSNQNPASDLVWSSMPGISAVTPGTTTYMRLRLSTDSTLNSSTATGEAENGEVEDYAITVYDAAPTPVNVTRSNPTASVTNANQVVFAITFSEDVQNVDTADFSVSGAGAAGASIPSVSGSGDSYSVTVDVADTAEGLVSLDVAATTGIQDLTGNDLSTVTPTGTVETYILDNTLPVITRVGGSPINVAHGSSYSDAGATASDNEDGDITASIVTVNPVNTASLGSYTVTYNVTDSAGNAAVQVTRQVNVVDLTPPVITLIGSSPLNVERGTTYTDAGATALDNIDGDVTSGIVTVNPVDTSTVGSYTVTYNVSDAAGNPATQVTRTVNVTNDATPPVITLLGSDPVSIYKDSTYSDAGATALDNIDGDITADIVTGNPVNTATIGSYTVTYDVSDSAGNAATQVTRTVNVVLDPDADEDGDGIPNSDEGSGDTDGDGVDDNADIDSDNDGILDSVEGNIDSDSDGIADFLDLDSDNDGLFDLIESGADVTGLDSDNDGMIDNGNSFGSNGLADAVETSADSGSVNYSLLDSDSDNVYNFRDLDSDGDGIYDLVEAGGTDSDNNGLVDGFSDLDSDGLTDSLSGSPLTNPDTDSDGVVDHLDLDSDNDGLYDVIESDGSDANGDGLLGDTAPQSVDANGVATGSGLGQPDTDGDGVIDRLDVDSDNDGIPDVSESGGSDPDGDGRVGSGTPTVDANGVTGSPLPVSDADGDGTPNQRDLDADGDGVLDIVEAGGTDADTNGLVDGFTDSDGDGLDDLIATTPLLKPDTDGDGIADFLDNDDQDNDGIVDSLDLDIDNDGIPNYLEGDGAVDTDGDGVVDTYDLDTDNDGLYDLYESGADAATLDSNNDGRIDSSESVGANGLADVVETAVDSGSISYNGGVLRDTDSDGVPDFRDLDSDNDGLYDVTETGGSDPDNDGVLGSGSPVVNSDGEASGAGQSAPDTDGDGVDDQRDLDSDNDGIPDVIEAGGSDPDADGEVGTGSPSVDPNTGVPLVGGGLVELDSDNDGTPNQRDTDSDDDGVSDLEESGNGANDTSPEDGVIDAITDTDGDGFDDGLEGVPVTMPDSDGDGTPDIYDSTDTPASSSPLQTGLNGVGGCTMGSGNGVDPMLPLLVLLSLAYLGLRQREKVAIRVK